MFLGKLLLCIMLLHRVQGQGGQNTNITDVLQPPPTIDTVDAIRNEISELKLQVRQEDLNIREEMYSMLGEMSREGGSSIQEYMKETVKELLGEVKRYQELTQQLVLEKLDQVQSNQESAAESFLEIQSDQTLALRNHESAAESFLEIQSNQALALRNQEEAQSRQDATLDKLVEVQSRQKSTLEALATVTTSQESTAGTLANIQSTQDSALEEATSCSNMIDLMRSEVRLLSLFKLTWQNFTNGAYQSDFVVDGVYNRVNDINGHNPISHSGSTLRNQVLIVDLGGLFNIHTVKIWSRIASTEIIGGFVYADDTLLGGIAEDKDLYNFRVHGTVFARKIFLKQSAAKYLSALEIQVFGSGPYGDDEVY